MQKMKETVLSNSSTFKGENGHERTINSVFLHSFKSHLCFLSSQLGLLLLKKKKKKKQAVPTSLLTHALHLEAEA